MKVQFSPPDITEAEINAVAEVMRSGWITTGPKTKKLESMVADYCGVNNAICLNSQTACAETALRILGVKAGDEVITTAYTYTATASIIHHIGAKIVLVDIQEDSLEMDYDKVEKAINKNTKAIIPVDIAGIPCNYDRLFEIVERKRSLFTPSSDIQEALGRVAIMADSAHSFGASYKGVKIGSVADFSSFSFHAVKNLTTAEGGALLWNTIEGIDDEKFYKHGQLLSLHGQSKDALAKMNVGSWEYDVVAPYFKYNMTDIMAAIGIVQLERYDGLLKKRKRIIEKYDNAFKPLGVKVLDHYTDKYSSSGHLYFTRIPGVNLEERNEIIIKMAKVNISCNVHYKPLPMLTAYKNLGFNIKDYPNSYKFFENEISLPLNTLMTDEEVEYVIDSFSEIIKEYIK